MGHSPFIQLRPHGEPEDIVAARLPSAAAKKLLELRQLVEDAWALQNVAADQRIELQQRKSEAISRLNYLLLPSVIEGGGAFEDHPDVIVQRKLIEAARSDLARIKAVYAPRAERTTQLSHLLENIERYILNLRSSQKVSLQKTPRLQLRKGQHVRTAIEKSRDKLLELKSKLKAAENAPVPSASAAAMARAEVARLANAGRPDVMPLLNGGSELQWPKNSETHPVIGAGSIVAVPYVDAIATLAWLFPDEMTARIEADIRNLANDDAALSADERVELVRDISRDLLAEERIEEALIQLAEVQRVEVIRRADADPRSVLGIEVE